jgi:hypothetical protein
MAGGGAADIDAGGGATDVDAVEGPAGVLRCSGLAIRRLERSA